MLEADPISILLVDDKPSNLVALEAALGGVDCRLVTAQSGMEALKCVLVQDFAVILLDIAMPRMDGFETANLIRSRERSRMTPIIFVTAHDSPGAGIQQGYRLGAIDYIYKPFDPYILGSKVALFVELFRKTQALEQRTVELTEVTAELAKALEQTAQVEAEMAASRASVLAEVSRVLVENFMDHGPMLGRVAHIAAMATGTACVIQLIAVDADDAGLVPLAIDHADRTVRAELARVLSVPQKTDDSPWQNLDPDFLELYPLMDTLSVPMLARTATIGVLSLGRFGSDAAPFTEAERGLSADLAARVGLAVENARLYHHAREAIEVRDTFLTVAAHELKTPLTTIQGYSQLLLHQLENGLELDPALVRRSAGMIEDRSRHLARLVEQVLDVSRLVASRMQLNRLDIDLVGMIRDLAAGFAHRNSLHEFRIHHPHERMQAAVDPTRMEQVMANLLDNAVRYSPDGGSIDITVEYQPDDSITFSVRDQGLGIPERDRAHIFERFFQAHTATHRSGMGLGLHISREIVLLHGGKITVAFPADGGSEFTVRLPRSVDTPAGAEVGPPRGGARTGGA